VRPTSLFHISQYSWYAKEIYYTEESLWIYELWNLLLLSSDHLNITSAIYVVVNF